MPSPDAFLRPGPGRLAQRAGRALRAMALLAAAGVAATACSTRPASLSAQVQAFATAAQLGQSDQLLATDVAEIGRGIGARRLVATHTACDGLAADAATALGELPSPEQTLTDELNRAYLDLARAAQDCSDVGHVGGGAFDRYRAEAGRGMAALHEAEARVVSLERGGRRGAEAK